MPKSNNLQRALDYIESNIFEDISLYDISREAGFSVPHFYRLFKKLTGDTVGKYILRRRIAFAAKALVESNKPISHIAFEYGFESHDVFTRAFTRIYGVSPNKYRHSSVQPPPLKRLDIINSNSDINEHQMSFSILTMNSFSVIGMECNAKQWDSDGAIGRLWGAFLSRVDEIKRPSIPMVMYGICENETCHNGQFRYMAAIGVDCAAEVPLGMSKRIIRAQSFFQASVPNFINTPDAYTSTVDYAKSLEYEIDDYDDLEVYEDTFQDPDIYTFKLLIPIK
ncbi:helix-turn-helix domain-containing protein [Clostridium oryzae]|uniref:Multiple antibiotic resistance protein MarA n=1 Tax=Clostridium oryzae TaxID=1450648 RepID=A0A1V4I9H1_9CLOT|nr:helix-turn-helix domain-containing protein [Clostridium oryzae]OPJ56167.1 multiple antibiotic resistance protein MarA [Clostridium oryzae]